MKLASIESEGINTLCFLKSLYRLVDVKDNTKLLDLDLLSEYVQQPVNCGLLRRAMMEMERKTSYKSGGAVVNFIGSEDQPFGIFKDRLKELIWKTENESSEINVIVGDYAHIGDGDHFANTEEK